MKYKKSHLVAALLSAFTLFSSQALAMSVDNLMQIVAKDSATGKTISWQSDSNRNDYSVEYRHKDQGDVQLAYVTEGKRPPIYDADNPAPYTYGAYMQKLTPATEYEYRIVNADGATDWITFSTTKDDLNQYKVLIFGDSQSTDYSVWGQTAQIAWQQNDDAAFFINMGDITDNGQAYFQWRDWFENADVLTSHIPFAPVLGITKPTAWIGSLPNRIPIKASLPYRMAARRTRTAWPTPSIMATSTTYLSTRITKN